MSKKPKRCVPCIVVFDDEQGLCCPMAADPDTQGGLCAGDGPVVVFHDRAAARRAIRISAAKARLCKAQGLPPNDDFLPPAASFLKIRKAVFVA